MSDAINPYESPSASAAPERELAAEAKLTEKMLTFLKEASPWIRFVGILTFIMAGITIISGIITLAAIPATADAYDLMGMGGFGAAFTVFTALFILGTGIITILLALFCYRFGDKIKKYLRTGEDYELERAFENNKSYWKLYGILSIIVLAFLVVLVVAIMIIAIVAATTAASMFW